MALAPGRQFHPATSFFDSFQSSFSKFYGTSIQFFRYSSSIPYKKHTFYANSVQDPHRESHILSTNRPVSSNSSSWIDKWNETHKQNGPKQPRDVLNYRSSSGSGSGSANVLNSSSVKSDGSSSSTMEKIVEKLKKFGYIDDGNEGKEKGNERVIEKGSVEDIFYVEEGMLPNSRGGFSPESPLGVESMFGGDGEVRFPWEKPKEKEKEEEGGIMARRKSRTSLAELTLPESELRRLRILTFQKKHKTRIGGAGVTQEVVEMIRERWKTSEIVRLKFEGAAALNMKRMHEILERKTGGLVIWRSGTSLSLYRGVSFEVPEVKLNKRILKKKEFPSNSLPTAIEKTTRGPSESGTDGNVHAPQANSNSTAVEKKVREPLPEVKYEDEVDKLLDGLGPRYTDWPGCDPLPVDADMLPAVVSGYQPPFRVLPYGVRSTLGAKDATNLRRLARVLPPHFALGRNRQLQGLAMAMIKLWERSSIAKIALKRGVQLTTSERMAEEIKKLTGGILLSRNKDFLVFYRGKNFLSPDVTEALLERETLAKSLQDEEEQARLRASALIIPRVEITEQSGIAGTLGETLDADARWGMTLDDRHEKKMMKEAEAIRHADLVRKLEHKLTAAERKVARAERALSKVEESLKPAERQADPESLTDEERFMFRKLGLRMKAFLLLGRRGVFDGTVENMHLHWKYRELVKVLVKAKTFDHVKKIALALEAESGGVLVSVDKVSKGYAIIVFRGNKYKRPAMLRPKNLLTKRKALARSIELQRREALLIHISALQRKVERIRSEIEQMEVVKDHGDEALYDKLDSAYSTDDDTEEEGDEAYLETYYSENDVGDDRRSSICNPQSETIFSYDFQNLESETKSEVPEPHEYAVPDSLCVESDEVEEENSRLTRLSQ